MRRLALSRLVGRDAARLDAEGDAGVDALQQQVRGYAEVLSARGVAGLLAALAEEQDLAARLLAEADGERWLTDVRHVAEVLHAEARRAGLGASGLAAWLRARRDEARTDLAGERSRRLDTERRAVQLVTLHGSKGLEFPVVLLPFAWTEVGLTRPGPRPRGRDDAGRALWVGEPAGPAWRALRDADDADEAAEELRLLYVGLTRAVSRLVVWWAASTRTAGAPLHRLLAVDDPAGPVPLRAPVPPGDASLVARARQRLAGAPARVVEVAADAPVPPLPAPVSEHGGAALEAAELHRSLLPGWRRTSYTGLTRDAHAAPGPAVRSEPEEGTKDDEDAGPPEPGVAGPAAAQRPSPMAELPGGTALGTLVHAVLEVARFAPGTDPRDALSAAVAEQAWRLPAAVPPAALVEALLPAVTTPLGPLADGRALAATAPRDRLVELAFELPLAGGERPVGAHRLADLAPLLERHLPPGDPVRGWAARLAHPDLADQRLAGYLTGSLDLVLRVGERHLVVDHKTNWLGPPGEPLSAWHYRPAALDEAVVRADYPLQALLYAVALHRYLRWRQPAYAPERHLGGVLYLFLRGMDGVGDTGVWSWQPPPALVLATSDLLAGGAA